MSILQFDWHIDRDGKIEELMERAAAAALDFEGFSVPAQTEVLMVDKPKIKELNKEYRSIDRETDVLSFPLYENAEEAKADYIPDEPVLLGDMVLCLPKAIEQAAEYGHSREREIAFLCVHSVLHLLGYDHEIDQREETEMFHRQEEIMKKLGITRG